MADRISPTPRNKLTGLLVDFLGGAYDYAQRPDPTMPMGKANPVLGLLADALPIKAGANVLDDLSYGQMPVRGTGMTTRLTPDATELALNAALSAVPLKPGFVKPALSTNSARSAKIFGGLPDPKPQPLRDFINDYSITSRQGQAGSLLTHDIEGRELTAPLVVGRQTWGGSDVAPRADQIAYAATGLGTTPRVVPQKQLGNDIGQYLEEKWNAPRQILLSSSNSPALMQRVQAHEVGHLVDDIAGNIKFKDSANELKRIYSDLNTPARVANWRKGVTSPLDQKYRPDEVPKEYAAEAVRAYLTDPNYIKTVAPKVAAAIRAHVNDNPELKKVIQFNSMAGLLGTGVMSQDEGD